MNSDLKNKYNLGGFTVSKLASSKAMQQGRSHIHPASQHSSQQNRLTWPVWPSYFSTDWFTVHAQPMLVLHCASYEYPKQPVLRPSTHILSFWLAWMRCSI